MSNISALSGMGSKHGTNTNNSITSSELAGTACIGNNNEEDDELVGSEYYISPEMLISRESSYASDLWAVGILLF